MKQLFRSRYVWVGLAVVVIGLGVTRVLGGASPVVSPFDTADVSRGSIVATVSATGALSAVGTVDVGTQVSGTIDRVLTDFNRRVQKGELLAVLDTVTLGAQVSDATAGVARSEAAQLQAEAERQRAEAQLALANAQQHESAGMLSRSQSLSAKGFLSAQELEATEASAATAAATVRSAEAQVAAAVAGVASSRAMVSSSRAALSQATKNRRNAEIRAPISGVVIQRSVDAGQTVASSFSTPTLFVIAEDLTAMEILAQVDESDIGMIKPGQPVHFSVAAYPARRFDGTVRERRLQPQTIQNVVHYTVVVAAINEEGLLLPGMTATLHVEVDRVDDALLVPSAAIRFQPTDALRAAARTAQRKAQTSTDRSTSSVEQPETSVEQNVAELWTPVAPQGLRPVLVRVIATDGVQTAIAPLTAADSALRVGFPVIIRSNAPAAPVIGR